MLAVIALIATLPSCVITEGAPHTQSKLTDAVATTLRDEPACPTDVFAFRALLSAKGYTFATTMVANRGFHNPAEGSFSFFEIIRGNGLEDGDAFFGHFVVKDGTTLVAEQTPSDNALMIEAFAFDNAKKSYNFYELRGDGHAGVWFYRGDSRDIGTDARAMHMSPKADFGTHLRCSGCHVNGAAIMKELEAPHNDWWTPERSLDFGGRSFEPRLAAIVATLTSPATLANATKASIDRFKPDGSLIARARPLFCPMELNLASDLGEPGTIRIPSGFFIDPRLAKATVTVSRKAYDAVLANADSTFPETGGRDADHAWLAPVKAYSDIEAINALVKSGELTEDFVLDVLAVDMGNPVFSAKRCALLTSDWKKIPHKTREQHFKDADAYLGACQKLNISDVYTMLMQRRNDVRASIISQNPKGQILEPGFRVIFPESPKAPRAGSLEFDTHCRVRRATLR